MSATVSNSVERTCESSRVAYSVNFLSNARLCTPSALNARSLRVYLARTGVRHHYRGRPELRAFAGDIQPNYGIELEDVDEAYRCRGSNGGRCGARGAGCVRRPAPTRRRSRADPNARRAGSSGSNPESHADDPR